MSFLKKKIQENFWLIFAISINILVHHLWFFTLNIFTYGDAGFTFIEKIKEMVVPSYWGTTGFGSVPLMPNYYPVEMTIGFASRLLAFLGLENVGIPIIQQMFFYGLPGLLGSIFSFKLVEKLTGKKLAGFVGSLVYNFNTFFLLSSSGHVLLNAAYVVLPISLYFLICFCENSKFSNGVLFVLTLFICGVYEFRATYIFGWVCLFYVIFYFLTNRKKIKVFDYFLRFFSVFLIFLLLNAFWLISTFLGGGYSSLLGVVLSRGLFKAPEPPQSLLISSLTLFHPYWANGIKLAPFESGKIPLYFFLNILPVFLMVFLKFKDFNQRLNKNFFLLLSLFGFLLSKFDDAPFINFYLWMYNHFPGFNAFREPSKFFVIVFLSYSIIFAFCTSWLLDNFAKTKVQKRLTYFLIVFYSFLFIYNARPIFTGESGAIFVPRYLPKDYLIFKDFVLRQPEFFRTFWSPTFSRWSINTNLHPIVSNLDSKNFEWKNFFSPIARSLNEGLVEIFKNSYSNQRFDNSSIKYIIVPIRDVANNDDFFINYGDRQLYIEELDKIRFLNKIDLGIKELSVYENKDFYPHFYTSQYQVYSTWKLDSLLKFYDLKSGLRTSLYASGKSPATQNLNEKKEFREVLEGMDEILIETNLENIAKDEELGNYRAPVNTILPFIAFKPGTFFNSLEVKKDEFDLSRLKKNSKTQFVKYLSLTNKKIAEYLKFGVSNLKQFDGYKKEILGAINNLKDLKTGNDKDLLKLVVQLRATLNWQYEKLKILKLEGQTELTVEDLFRELNEEANKLKPTHEFKTLVYKFEIPKEGEYEIYQREKGIQVRDMGDEIEDMGENDRNIGNEIEDKGRLATESAENTQNTTYQIQNTNRPELLKIGNIGWKLLDKKYFKEGGNELVFDNPDLGENLLDDNLKLKEYFPDTVYKASFRYKASGYGSLAINEGKEGVLFTQSLPKTGDGLQNFETYFKSSPFAEKAFLSLSVDELEGLRVEKVKQEEIILRLNADNTDYADSADNADGTRITRNPTISFQFINPTKYKVKVEGAKDPYTLIFSENFHKGWKIYVSGADGNKKLEIGNNEIVAEYFDGEVKEKKSGNGFDKNIFETWKKKPIADNRHLTANGFANSWYIKPTDVSGKENYELIVEFEPQRWLYIGLGISLATLIGCLGYLAFAFSQKRG